jgi:tetratricopeptide (TPR) repeat protein
LLVTDDGASAADEAAATAPPVRYRPQLQIPPALEPILRHLKPGDDAFPEEKDAEEMALRLDELGASLRKGATGAALDRLLAPQFKGARLRPAEEVSVGSPSFEVVRSKTMPSSLELDRTRFEEELRAFVADLGEIGVAELLITSIEVDRAEPDAARTEVRYDLVGKGREAGRAQRVGRWRLRWRRGSDGGWRIAEWTAADDVRSRAARPVFTERTLDAFGANASFQGQLAFGLDAWLATIDSVFMLDSMGHHGVSVGDADGDGLEDLYVAQPTGLPNRLFRNRGDGTFEDVTESASLAVLDDTSQSLFADVDNDGDEDLVLVARAGPLLFVNDGRARFTLATDAFRYEERLRGSPISVAIADYDRDGFLDVYLCTYSYFMGAGEDKAGAPNPYHDARNGPPNVLFRNDGRGRFVDVTKETGLDANNDRFSFAAAWGDYDDDGWPDLLVANDFGAKNLYRNLGARDGKVRFEDVTVAAGVEDYGAGMSAAWVDYDNDGRLDIYTGNMWSAAGRRVTSLPGFMPQAPAEMRELYRRHARGNALFRNRGDGTFEDATLAARAEMGRWAWSSDALDFDSDGFEDLYVANGMFTRDGPEGAVDLDGFFWRQVTARSPLTRVTGTSYDEAWRAINRILAGGSQANHQRNVFLRNDGHGAFDEVSGSVGLDLDQDGRSFAVLDYDLDGDPDVVSMAARSAPQLRLFRNEHERGNAVLALRLTGKPAPCGTPPKASPQSAQPQHPCSALGSSRDAVGARVTVETDTLRRTKSVAVGSGFISQHSKELLFGLGASTRIVKVEVRWPSGLVQIVSGLAPGQRARLVEGEEPRTEALHDGQGAAAAGVARAAGPVGPPSASWLYEPYPAPDFALPDLEGGTRTLSSLRGKPVLLVFWSTSAAGSHAALTELTRGLPALREAGVAVLSVALDATQDETKVRVAARGLAGLPVALGSQGVGVTYTLLHRYLFVARQDLPLPTALLLDDRGAIVRAYRDRFDAAAVVADVAKLSASPSERLARAMPFAGTLLATPGQRNYLQYGLELVEQGLENEALSAFERAAKGDPNAFTLYSLGALYVKGGQPERARAAFERALQVKPDFSEASNGLGALMAQGGDLLGAIARFRIALETTPDYPDALNNLGYALLQSNQDQDAHELFLRALALQPDFPEAFNNLGIYFARQGDPPQAESHFRQAVDRRPSYGEAGNNLALVLMAREDVEGATAVLQRLLKENPGFEMTYVTLSKLYLSTGRQREGVQVLERLLQKNPSHPLALEMMRGLRAGR